MTVKLLTGLDLRRFILWGVASLLLINSSCVNDIVDDENVTQGTIPIHLAASVESTKTRVTDTAFEENDVIGLYITVQPATIAQARYVDNMKFTCNTSDGLTPDEVIFFPEGDNLCDFISYYPYSKEGVKKKTSSIEVGVQTNQSEWKSYSASNFMVAKSTAVSAQEDPVQLTFENKHTRVNIQLKPQSGYSTEMLLSENPVVKIKNVYSKASYDFAKDEFTGFNKLADVIPYGTWEVSNDLLTGKSVILVPQNLASGTIVELVIGEKVFECTPQEDLILTSGTSRDIIFSIVPSSDGIKGNVSVSLKGWEIVPKKELDITETPSYVYIPDVDFKASGVYKVINKGNQVAELCKEYLLSSNINAQAIVAYPMLDGKTDLSNGLVCALLDSKGVALPEEVHGGKVSWDQAANQLTYHPGDLAVIDYIYVSKNNKITTTRTENTLQLQLQADKLIDIRGSESITYPLVKLGIQYWMRGNMKATYYTDGSAVKRKENFGNIAAGYATPNDTYYFYNSASISSGLLIPEGWRIGNTADWNKMKDYLKDDVSELRGGNAWGTSITITNLSGFNVSAVGVYQETYKDQLPCVYYWSSKESDSDIMDKLIKISAQNDHMENVTSIETIGASIRCIRE